MTNNFLKMGDMYSLTSEESLRVYPSLPVGTYSVGFDLEKGYFLKKIEDLVVEGKVYGDVGMRTARVLNTFDDRPSTTGVILRGEKGSGKTLLARNICQEARRLGIITLVINSPLCGEGFNNFISGIDQPCVVMFDEFEKVYAPASSAYSGKSSDSQSALLTLFDGLYKTKKLFLVTCNDITKIDQAMRNRPGRFFYSFTYRGLEEEFVREYCEDVLKDKTQISSIVLYSKQFNNFNFDMLKAIVEEMNRYGETVIQVVKYLNAEPSGQKHVYRLLSIEAKDGTDILKPEQLSNDGHTIDIFAPNTVLYVRFDTEQSVGKNYENEDRPYAGFYSRDIVDVTGDGQFTFDNGVYHAVFQRVMKEKKKDFEGMAMLGILSTAVDDG